MEKELLKQKQRLAKALAEAKTMSELDELLIQMKNLREIFEREGIEFMKDKHNNGKYNKIDSL